MNKIIYISKSSTRNQEIRYKIAEYILKIITPSLYKRLKTSIRLNKKFFIHDLLVSTPRPAIKKMKEYFNNISVKGVEIGVRKGINAESILKELNIKKLFLIDPYINKQHYDITFSKLKGKKEVIFIREVSNKAINQFKDNSLDFVYIDANHNFDFVFQDIKMWYNKVKRNGIIAGHDVFVCRDVLIAVREFCFKKRIGYFIEFPDWYFIKKEK